MIEFQECVLLLLLLGVIIVVEFSRGKIPLLSGCSSQRIGHTRGGLCSTV